MNPWVIGIVGVLIGAIPSVIFYTQLSPLQRKLQQAERGKERAEQSLNQAESELEEKKAEMPRIPQLEAQYQDKIDNLKQSHQVQIEELQRLQTRIPTLEAQIEEMKASQMQVVELEEQLAKLREAQSLFGEDQPPLSEEGRQTLIANHQAEIEAILQTHQGEIQQLQQDNQSQLQAIQHQHHAELEELRTHHQAQLQEIELRYQSERQALESTYQQQILEIQQDYEQQLLEAAISSPEIAEHPALSLTDAPAEAADIEELDALLDLANDELDDIASCPFVTSMTAETFVFVEDASSLEEIREEDFDLSAIKVSQNFNYEEDIEGLDDFLKETEEMTTEAQATDASLADEAEQILAQLPHNFSSSDSVNEETLDFPDLETSRNLTDGNDIEGLDEFLKETADMEETEEEMAFLSSLQADDFNESPSNLPSSDEEDDLPAFSEADNDFLNVSQLEDQGQHNDVNDPFADIFGHSAENGQKSEQHLEGFDELFSLSESETSTSDKS